MIFCTPTSFLTCSKTKDSSYAARFWWQILQIQFAIISNNTGSVAVWLLYRLRSNNDMSINKPTQTTVQNTSKCLQQAIYSYHSALIYLTTTKVALLGALFQTALNCLRKKVLRSPSHCEGNSYQCLTRKKTKQALPWGCEWNIIYNN